MYDVHLCASCMIVDHNVDIVRCILLHANLVFLHVSDRKCHLLMVCIEALTW